jgi:aminoglycoside 6'-N-acetyltransferase I
MITNAEIRPAHPDEQPQLLTLAQHFYTDHGFTTPAAELRDNLETLLHTQAARVTVAIHDATVAGFAITTTSFGLEQGHLAELQDLYIIPTKRGHGLGRALIDDSATWAHTQRCQHLELVIVPNGHDISHLLTYYTRQGFSDQGRRLLTRHLNTPR